MIGDRSLLGLASAELISRLGSQLSNLALPWFVLVTTHSPAHMGFVFAVELVPFVLFGIPAGSIVERFGPRSTMLGSDLARAPIVAAVPFLHAVGGLSYGVVLSVAFLHGLFSTAYFTCQRVAIPSIVGDDEQRIARANSLIEGATNVTSFGGPALAGVLIALIGAANVMWFDAASYLVAFLLIAFFVRVTRVVSDPAGGGGLWAGLGYLRRDRFVGRAVLTPLLFGFNFPIIIASFPVIAYRDYNHDPRVAGWLLMAYGGGSVLGSFATYLVLAWFPPVQIAVVAAAGLAAPMWLLVPHVPLAVMILALGIIGFSNPLSNAPYFGILSSRVPPALLPKVIQVIITSNQVAGPLGFAIAGVLFASIGLHAAYFLAAVVGTVASLNFAFAVTSSTPTSVARGAVEGE